jgi:hypothetical protein
MTVTSPKGFRAGAVAAGLKAAGGLDVAVVVNDGPDATAAGVFTANRVKAAPVLWSQQVLRSRHRPGGRAQRGRRQPPAPARRVFRTPTPTRSSLRRESPRAAVAG